MDKNMINIDELVKSRLSGGEESQAPGSWLRMRELLDQEMPEKKRRVAGYYSWRRTLGVMTGLVLFSALAVGGYNAYRATHSPAAETAANPAALSHAYRSGKSTVNRSLERTQMPDAAGVQNLADHSNAGNNPSSRNNNQASTAATSATVANSDYPAQETHTASAAPHGNNENGDLTDTRKLSSGTLSSSAPATNLYQSSHVRSGKKIKSIIVATENEGIKKKDIAVDSKRLQSETTQGNNAPSSESTQHGKFTALSVKDASLAAGADTKETKPTTRETISNKPALSSAAGATNNSGKLKDNWPAPIQPDRVRDTLKKLTIVQHVLVDPLTLHARLVSDTISIDHLIVEKPITLAQGGVLLSDAAENPPVAAPAAALTSDASAAGSLQPLSNFKIKSRKTDNWNAHSFDEVVKDVKFRLAQVRFYPGISIGANSNIFGQNNLSGFQLGLFGLFTFGETWSAMGELKYIHRFNGGALVNDDYTDISTKPGMQANVRHFFQFTSLQSIEMPLALRYAAGRLNLFGGANVAYHFAINADEQTEHPNEAAYTKQVGTGPYKTSPVVLREDFNARFALGGLLGASYEFSPSLQLDLRATKSFWDNGYGLGAEKVSREFYAAPSIQMSIFYRFSQRNQIPRAR